MYHSAKRSRLIYIFSMYLQQYLMVSGGQRKSNIYDSFRDSLFSDIQIILQFAGEISPQVAKSLTGNMEQKPVYLA